ncbi:DUF5807 family protein [Halomicrococcus sp. NG-SE-24]|uniref:DUF5807 family protein n=1 Tax=Halomicrococcus sp. NG-SE-24 TaxID=3436928 RepID=UPI003D97E457
MSKREEFLAGERVEDVALFLADSFVDGDSLADHGESVPDGTLLVVPGDTGRSVFQTATGMEAMGFAKRAMGTEGTIDADLTGGECPAAGEEADGDESADHETEFVFAFAEEQNEDVGDIYAEGDVIHAYAYCDCGTAYSHKWVAGER